jgi:hypothetical protein
MHLPNTCSLLESLTDYDVKIQQKEIKGTSDQLKVHILIRFQGMK